MYKTRRRILPLVRQVWRAFRREKLHRLFILCLIVVIMGALGFFIFEAPSLKHSTHPTSSGIIDSIWWSCVTLTTVGYGDVVPKTTAGRLIGVFVMFSGIVVMSLITAIIASVLVERKIREDRGLESFDVTNHLVLCGWNENADDILKAISQAQNAPKTVILINDLEEEQINEIKFKHRGELDVHFIRGDFVNESVLDRAMIANAYSVILLSDVSGRHDRSKADERVILATLAIKHKSEKVRVTAELLDRQNESHLQRAKADEIIVRGKYSSFFLANSALSPGLHTVIGDLLSLDPRHQVLKVKIPGKFTGRTFRELFDYIRTDYKAIIFAIISVTKGMSFDDLLTDDLSAIDDFIRRKFQEAGADLSVSSDQINVTINPPDGYKIKENDYMVIIASNVE